MSPIQNSSIHPRGFTLIELLTVIATIGILSSVVLSSLNSARLKAIDTRKRADFKSISTALQFYYDKHGTMPANLVPGTQVCDGGPNQTQYDQLMGSLVSGGFLAQIPRSPGGGGYCYYNYGANTPQGALLVTWLQVEPSTTTGISPSCRPWAPATNWCSQDSSKEYCICNPF
jgi:prepilin-type N-terminal cleavage/methylation domain-containing protein